MQQLRIIIRWQLAYPGVFFTFALFFTFITAAAAFLIAFSAAAAFLIAFSAVAGFTAEQRARIKTFAGTTRDAVYAFVDSVKKIIDIFSV